MTLGFGFNTAKCETNCRLALGRFKLSRNKKNLQIKQYRKEIAELLKAGKQEYARIRVESVIRENLLLQAYEILELYVELLTVRTQLMAKTKEIPGDMVEAVSSIIYSSQRISDMPELIVLRQLFASKYGKEYAAEAAADATATKWQVNTNLIRCLLVEPPRAEEKLAMLSEIAQEYGVEWDLSAAAREMAILASGAAAPAPPPYGQPPLPFGMQPQGSYPQPSMQPPPAHYMPHLPQPHQQHPMQGGGMGPYPPPQHQAYGVMQFTSPQQAAQAAAAAAAHARAAADYAAQYTTQYSGGVPSLAPAAHGVPVTGGMPSQGWASASSTPAPMPPAPVAPRAASAPPAAAAAADDSPPGGYGGTVVDHFSPVDDESTRTAIRAAAYDAALGPPSKGDKEAAGKLASETEPSAPLPDPAAHPFAPTPSFTLPMPPNSGPPAPHFPATPHTGGVVPPGGVPLDLGLPAPPAAGVPRPPPPPEVENEYEALAKRLEALKRS